MTGYRFFRLTFILAIVVAAAMFQLPVVHGASSYSSEGSWAVGVVVPENSELAEGGKLNCNSVRNVTALFNLPNISVTDGTIYAIMSLMAENGSIVQVAAGLCPNSSWLVYAMYILNPNSYPQVYRQATMPREISMLPGDLLSMSIYFSGGKWWFTVKDITRNASAISYFNACLPGELKKGDQYVFALESYSFNSSVFKSMSNMTLYGLFLNGREVESGWYLYTTWNNENFPLFIVGGATPPSFISASFTGSATVTWSFVSPWSARVPSSIPFSLVVDVLVAAVVVNICVLAVLLLKRNKRNLGKGYNLQM
ncbi:MAG: hypothetical protein QXV38_00270 [Conexivisphaerales archaeon]